MQNKKKGFTLIELLVVIVMIGILASIGISTLNGHLEKARDAKRISQFKQTIDLIKLYVAENETLPTLTGTASPVACSGWRVTSKTYTEQIIELGTVFGYKLQENYWDGCNGFKFYRYNQLQESQYGCPTNKGHLLVFKGRLEQIVDGTKTASELGLGAYTNFSCSSRDWTNSDGGNIIFGIFEDGSIGSQP